MMDTPQEGPPTERRYVGSRECRLALIGDSSTVVVPTGREGAGFLAFRLILSSFGWFCHVHSCPQAETDCYPVNPNRTTP
jgi:hypothetical protein